MLEPEPRSRTFVKAKSAWFLRKPLRLDPTKTYCVQYWCDQGYLASSLFSQQTLKLEFEHEGLTGGARELLQERNFRF